MLWPWRRPAATALIRPLAWEFPYAADAAVKGQKKKKRERERENKKTRKCTCDLYLVHNFVTW